MSHSYIFLPYHYSVILCSALITPENGSIAISSTMPFRVGTTATYSCQRGSVLIGETTRTCEGDTTTVGEWSGDVPACELCL